MTNGKSGLPEHAVNPQFAWETSGKVPRVFGKHKIVLHAYAGRRRRGDIEWYMLEIAKLHPDHIIMTASVDIIIDSVYGDIARQKHVTIGFFILLMDMSLGSLRASL